MNSRLRKIPAQEHGFALLEAIVAFLILSFGVLALAWLQGELRHGTDAARQQTEAARLAQIDIEHLRAFADLPGWEAITDDLRDVTPPGSTTRFSLQRIVTRPDPALKAVQVTLRWNDRRGAERQLRFDTLIAGHDPALAGALTLPHPALTRR
jgi:hypothetical protein